MKFMKSTVNNTNERKYYVVGIVKLVFKLICLMSFSLKGKCKRIVAVKFRKKPVIRVDVVEQLT